MKDEYLAGIMAKETPAIADFAAQRWNKRDDPGAHTPRDALIAALRDIDSGVIDPRHLVIVYAQKTEPNEDPKTGYYQAGDLGGVYGALGLLARASHLIQTPQTPT